MIRRKYQRSPLLIISVIIVIGILILQSSYSIIEKQNSLQYIDSIDYLETLDILKNPERGFYYPVGYNLELQNNQPLNLDDNLVHLRVGIGAFSSVNNNQRDLELSDDALKALKQTFDLCL